MSQIYGSKDGYQICNTLKAYSILGVTLNSVAIAIPSFLSVGTTTYYTDTLNINP